MRAVAAATPFVVAWFFAGVTIVCALKARRLGRRAEQHYVNAIEQCAEILGFAETQRHYLYACPGGPAVNVDLDRCVAQCPHCAYTFSTLINEPIVPPHYVNGDEVTFPPPASWGD